jgi:hypothetical protein
MKSADMPKEGETVTCNIDPPDAVQFSTYYFSDGELHTFPIGQKNILSSWNPTRTKKNYNDCSKIPLGADMSMNPDSMHSNFSTISPSINSNPNIVSSTVMTGTGKKIVLSDSVMQSPSPSLSPSPSPSSMNQYYNKKTLQDILHNISSTVNKDVFILLNELEAVLSSFQLSDKIYKNAYNNIVNVHLPSLTSLLASINLSYADEITDNNAVIFIQSSITTMIQYIQNDLNNVNVPQDPPLNEKVKQKLDDNYSKIIEMLQSVVQPQEK